MSKLFKVMRGVAYAKKSRFNIYEAEQPLCKNIDDDVLEIIFAKDLSEVVRVLENRIITGIPGEIPDIRCRIVRTVKCECGCGKEFYATM